METVLPPIQKLLIQEHIKDYLGMVELKENMGWGMEKMALIQMVSQTMGFFM